MQHWLSKPKPEPEKRNVSDVGLLRLRSPEHVFWFKPGSEFSTIFYWDKILVYNPSKDSSKVIKTKNLLQYDVLPSNCLAYIGEDIFVSSDDNFYVFNKRGKHLYSYYGDSHRPYVFRISDVFNLTEDSLLIAGVGDSGETLSINKLEKNNERFDYVRCNEYNATINWSFTGNVKHDYKSLNPVVSCLKNDFVCYGEIPDINGDSEVDWIAEDKIIFNNKELQWLSIGSYYVLTDPAFVKDYGPYNEKTRYCIGRLIGVDHLVSVSQWILNEDDYCILPGREAPTLVKSGWEESDYDKFYIVLYKYRKIEGKYIPDGMIKLKIFYTTIEDLKRAAKFYADIE